MNPFKSSSNRIDVNFVTPPPKYANLIRGNQIYLLLGILGVVLIVVVGIFYLDQQRQLINVKKQIDAVRENMVSRTPEVIEYFELREELEAEQEIFKRFDAALPDQQPWPDLIEDVVTSLPGIGTYTPRMTLSRMSFTSEAARPLTDFNLSSNAPYRISAIVSLSGTANDTETVTQTIRAFQQESRYAVAFTGTTGQGDSFSFATDLAFLEATSDSAASPEESEDAVE